MESKTVLIGVRYYIILLMLGGIVTNKADITNNMVILTFIYIINNQLRFFSLEKRLFRIASLIIEIILSAIIFKLVGGYLFTYLILAALDSNTLFERTATLIFNALIITEDIYFNINNSLQMKFINIGTVTIIIAVLYFINDEKDKKLRAQNLYDKLKISEDKLKKVNKDLEVYASSIEEITLLRERNRISREIHDSIGHALSTIAIQLGAIEKIIEKDDAAAKELTKALRDYTQKSLNDVRKAVREIKPKEFEEYEGILIIEELINNFKKLTGVDVRLSFTKEKWPLNSDQAFVIYRIVQEFLANSVRHGKATVIHIVMAFSEYKLMLTLRDNGKGAVNIKEGIGLKSIRERVNELGGTFDYNSIPDGGFLVKIELDRKEKLKIYSKEESDG